MTSLRDAIRETEPEPPKLKVERLLEQLVDHDDYPDILEICRADKEDWPHKRTAEILTVVTGVTVIDKDVSAWRGRL